MKYDRDKEQGCRKKLRLWQQPPITLFTRSEPFLPVIPCLRRLVLWQGRKKLLKLAYKMKGYSDLARQTHLWWCRDIETHRRWLAQSGLGQRLGAEQ